MKSNMVILFVLLSVKVTLNRQIQHVTETLHKHNVTNIEKEVNVTNWGNYGLKPGEIRVSTLKNILVDLESFQRGGCPFGQGKCNSLSATSVLSKLIENLADNVTKSNEA